MNKIIQIPLAIIFTLVSAAVLAQRCFPVPFTFENERSIDTTEYTKPGMDVRNEEADFRSHFGLKTGTLNSDKEVFSVSSLIEEMFIPVRKQMRRDDDCKNRRCVSVVVITYGLEGNDIRLIYEPTYLKLKSIIPGPVRDTLNLYNPMQPAKAFVDNHGKFEPVEAAVVKKMKKAYKDSVVKNPNVAPGPVKTPLGPDDPEAAIFSFQEIVKFNHVVSDFPSTGDYYCEKMEIHHGCVFLPDGSGPKKAKHTLFFTKSDWTTLVRNKDIPAIQIQVLSPLGEGDGANLAHLCPPRCSAMSYPAE